MSHHQDGFEAPPGLGEQDGALATARSVLAWRLVVIPAIIASVLLGSAILSEGATMEFLFEPVFDVLEAGLGSDDLSILLVCLAWCACTVTGMVLGRYGWRHGLDAVTTRRGRISFWVGVALMAWLGPVTLLFMGVVLLNPLLF